LCFILCNRRIKERQGHKGYALEKPEFVMKSERFEGNESAMAGRAFFGLINQQARLVTGGRI
jgi:hypothetical protein